MRKYGARLHDAVFEQAREFWDGIVSRGRGNYIIDLEPSLWKLHWELLYHQDFGYLDTLSTPIVRGLGRAPYPSEVDYLDNPSIYFVGADPVDYATCASDQYEKLHSQIPSDLSGLQILTRCKRDPKNEIPQWERMVDDLRKSTPGILHIVAHGEGAKGLTFEGKSRYEKVVVGYETLTELLINVKRVELLIVAACGSSIFFEGQPHLVRRLLDRTKLRAVVLMASDISAEASIKFTELFYKALWNRVDVAHAVAYARSILRSQGSRPISLQWSVPMLYESSPVNPFGRWLNEVRETVSAPPLPFKHLEAAQTEARNISKEVSNLVNLRQQAHPASSSTTYTTAKLKQACQRYRQMIGRFDQRYSPEDEFLLDSIRLTSSQALPIIDRFVLSATGCVDSDKAIVASENLVESLDEAVSLVLVRASREFQSWIES